MFSPSNPHLVIVKDPIAEEEVEGELIKPESEDEDEVDVLTIVNSSLSISTMAREAAASVWASRVGAVLGTSRGNMVTAGRTAGRKRAGNTVVETQAQKKQETVSVLPI